MALEPGLDPVAHDREHDRRHRLGDICVLANCARPCCLKQVVEPIDLSDRDVGVVRERSLDGCEILVGWHLTI